MQAHRRIMSLALTIMVVSGCDQYKEHDCQKIAMAVATGIANDTSLGGRERSLAIYLDESVAKPGRFHSHETIFRACQKMKYNPNSPY